MKSKIENKEVQVLIQTERNFTFIKGMTLSQIKYYKNRTGYVYSFYCKGRTFSNVSSKTYLKLIGAN